tara:strand:- start:14283 stop:14543 length:261 start_codon:yes stop_codon:yes gene_type:complete
MSVGIGNQNEKFEIDKSKLAPLAATLSTEIVNAFEKSKSGGECGQKVAVAIQKYLDGTIALIETSVESQGFQKAMPPGSSGGVGGI